ncbi:MAG: OmpA family protein [Verrucomicrobia bacterium]|nr:OmpA family protein [Verrucomicrobiota bacterium]
MKKVKFLNLIVSALVLSVAVVGCKKNPYGVTPLPGQRAGKVGEPGAGTPIEPPSQIKPDSTGLLESADPSKFANWPEDRAALSAQTVYFDFDSSTVKASEKSKIEAVADYIKKNPGNALRIEGHCDERGTEEYNRSLGERRALALREYLANLGSSPDRILTVSFGKDQPADPGHDEAAWAKNRRGVFVVLTPPK